MQMNILIPGTNINILTNVEQFHRLTITPQLATWLLGRSTGNRGRVEGKIRPQHLAYLEQIIERGEWQACHQGGAIDWHGRLFDGHHRLTAISRQQLALPMWFKIGCDPAEDKVIDQGVARSMADLTGVNARVMEVVTLAARIYNGSQKISPGQVRDMLTRTTIKEQIELLLSATPTVARYYSSAPMRLAAVIRLMQGCNPDYILRQYRALVLLEFDEMSICTKALVKQVSSGALRTNHTYDTLSRGLLVFDQRRSHLARITVTNPTDAARNIRTFLSTLLLPNSL